LGEEKEKIKDSTDNGICLLTGMAGESLSFFQQLFFSWLLSDGQNDSGVQQNNNNT